MVDDIEWHPALCDLPVAIITEYPPLVQSLCSLALGARVAAVFQASSSTTTSKGQQGAACTHCANNITAPAWTISRPICAGQKKPI